MKIAVYESLGVMLRPNSKAQRPEPRQRPRHDLHEIAQRAMLERGFQPDFSDAAWDEAESAQPAHPQRAAPAGEVRDLRALLWSSIDNDDSRDLDQLAVAEALADGTTKILVAIADVDALTQKGSAIDDHARHNTTSVYTAAEVFSMLPERLSTDLTSLNASADRLAIVVEMIIDDSGALRGSAVYRAWVKNHAKLAYNSVAAWLDGESPPPAQLAAVPDMDEQIRLQDRVAASLKQRRHRHGALDLETLEPRAVFDGNVFSDLRLDPKNRAKQLIEDFMIAANGVTARFLSERGFPSLRRVLRSPKRWDRIVKLAADLDEALPAEPDPAALEAFLQKRRHADPSRFADLSLSVVKLMGAGEYALERASHGTKATQNTKTTPPGHFGLAVRDYAHSTAPNRRFPDLITQRLLKAALAGNAVPYTDAELVDLAQHCTQKEDDANKVERQVRKSAAALLLDGKLGQRFEAIVTGRSEKGTWVRLCRPPVEGKLVDPTPDLDVGDRLHVVLVSTDVERGFIDFRCAKREQD